MTNLAVVNISYLKFSGNARGIMDSDRECAAAAIAIAVICKKRKRRMKNNVGKNSLIGSRTARRENVLSQSAYLFTFSNYQSCYVQVGTFQEKTCLRLVYGRAHGILCTSSRAQELVRTDTSFCINI